MPAFDEQALWNKSKLFVERALKARDDSDDISFHLWAALSLELLGKAALSKIHPALVADPSDQKSLFYACGIKDPPNKKSIGAKTLYERLPQLSAAFDDKLKLFCMIMADRRNGELHSGESPLAGLDQRAWVINFWRAVAVILSMQSKSLEDWLGPSEAASVTTILADAAELQRQNVISRIARRLAEYSVRFPDKSDERREAKARSHLRSAPHRLEQQADELEDTLCPACLSKAWLLGREWGEEVIDHGTEGNWDEGFTMYETVQRSYSVEAFRCIECGLILDGRDEIETADLPTEFNREITREPDYGPDYGNE